MASQEVQESAESAAEDTVPGPSSSSSAASKKPGASKRIRRALTLEDKYKIVKAINDGVRQFEVAKLFDPPLSQSIVATIAKKKEEITSAYEWGFYKDKRKKLRPSTYRYPNLDKTLSGMVSETTPTQTLNFRGEKCTGGKKSVTVMVACNQDGTDKLPLLVIGKYAKPRCFKNSNMDLLPVTYESQRKAWIDHVLFEQWLRKIDRKMKAANRAYLDVCG
ncbi:hypothetical protein QZH41_002368 [Actinostola sp. cb2023]|nr:hypothetical protein QZH41_002368 [Actinostola sp. cb2023]